MTFFYHVKNSCVPRGPQALTSVVYLRLIMLSTWYECCLLIFIAVGYISYCTVCVYVVFLFFVFERKVSEEQRVSQKHGERTERNEATDSCFVWWYDVLTLHIKLPEAFAIGRKNGKKSRGLWLVPVLFSVSCLLCVRCALQITCYPPLSSPPSLL